MTVAWTHATEAESGRTMRGFRGKIFFYPKEKLPRDVKLADKDHDHPIKVEGTLTVYAFEMMGNGKLNPVAPRKFLFKPEQFKKQLSESKQGPSYSVWLPWDTVGGPPKQINLWSRFDGINQGAVVMSDHSPQLLPGESQLSAVAKIAGAVKPQPRPAADTERPAHSMTQTGYESSGEPAEKHTAENIPDTSASPGDWWK